MSSDNITYGPYGGTGGYNEFTFHHPGCALKYLSGSVETDRLKALSFHYECVCLGNCSTVTHTIQEIVLPQQTNLKLPTKPSMKKYKQSPGQSLKRTTSANLMHGLTVVLDSNARQSGAVVMNNYLGLKGLVHNPREFPEVGGKGFAIRSGEEIFVAIGAHFTEASSSVKNMPLKRRKCLHHGEDVGLHPEVKLDLFLNYSQKACVLECQARHMQEQCGCLPYYFPDFNHVWKKNTICNLSGLLCLANVSSKYPFIRWC